MLTQKWLFFLLLLLLLQTQIAAKVYADQLHSRELTDQVDFLTLWNDHPEILAEKGIQFSGYFATTLQQNLGGLSEGFAYAGLLDAGLTFDLEKLFKIPGASFYFSGSLANGSNLSAAHIGNTFYVSNVYSGQSLRFYELWWDQKLHHERLDIKTGRLSPTNDFGSLPVFSNYVSNSISGIVAAVIYNDYSVNLDPIAQWGSRLIVNTTDDLTLKIGVYTSDPQDLYKNSKHGLDFAFRPSHGILTMGELDYQWHHTKGSAGMPGQLLIGGYYDSSQKPTLNNPLEKATGDTLFYLASQQMIFQPDGPDTEQGLTIWGVYAYAPSQSISLFPHFMAAGLSYHGLFSQRPDDDIAIGATKGCFSADQSNSSFESILEMTYSININSLFTIQPDLQYVIKPSGSSNIPNAWVFGVMAMLQFG